jgi:Tfp pilus assembly protein PilZ
MSRHGGSQALVYSQAEFAYILLFIALGALSLLFLQYRAVKEEVVFLLEQIEKMEEKKDAAYPCWIRPDGIIPRIAGVVVIHSDSLVEIRRSNGGFREIRSDGENESADSGRGRRDELFTALRQMFREDNQFATCNHCYIRVQIENRTNDYSLYLETAQVLRSLGIVAVNE